MTCSCLDTSLHWVNRNLNTVPQSTTTPCLTTALRMKTKAVPMAKTVLHNLCPCYLLYTLLTSVYLFFSVPQIYPGGSQRKTLHLLFLECIWLECSCLFTSIKSLLKYGFLTDVFPRLPDYNWHTFPGPSTKSITLSSFLVFVFSTAFLLSNKLHFSFNHFVCLLPL